MKNRRSIPDEWYRFADKLEDDHDVSCGVDMRGKIVGELSQSQYQKDRVKNDGQLRVAKIQELVPEGCYLDGFIVMAAALKGEDPCAGCNMDRTICHGRPHR